MSLTDITFASLYFNFILNGNPLFQRTNGNITYIFIRDSVLEAPLLPPSMADCLTNSAATVSLPIYFLPSPFTLFRKKHWQRNSLAFIKLSTVYIISNAILGVQNILCNKICSSNHGNTFELEFQNIILCKWSNFHKFSLL